MKGKIIIIVSALILASGVFILADKGNITSAFSQNKTKAARTDNAQADSQAKPQSKADEINAIEPVGITEKNIKNSSEYINVDVKFPVIGGLNNTEIQNKINVRFEKDAESFINENTKNAQKDSEDFKKQGIELRKYEAVSQYCLQYNKNGFLSITVDYYMYTGGAHGMTDRVAYNYDLNTGEELKLSHLFKKDFNYKDFINNEILKQMKTGEDIYFHDEGGFKTISDDQRFYLADGNIVIYFTQYEIAPYAAGIPEFKIQLSGLKDNLEIQP